MGIRLFQQEDYEAAYRLWVNTPGMGLNTTDDSRDGVLRYLRRNPNTCFVAEEAGEVVGVILAGHDGRRGFIYHLAVSVSHRNKGIGSMLVEHAMEHLNRKESIKSRSLSWRETRQETHFGKHAVSQRGRT